jgi:hypothetical protein
MLVVPRGGLPRANDINNLGCQTEITAPTELKGLSGALANRLGVIDGLLS